MQKTMFADIPRDDRLQLLKDNADGQSNETFMRDLTGEEVDAKRELVVDNCIELNRLEAELKETKDRYKEMMNPLKDANKRLLGEVKSRKEEKTGLLFSFVDHGTKTVTTYDEYGDYVSNRRMKDEEKQARLFIPRDRRNGTED